MELDRRWYSQSRGKGYGPGSAEVPEDVAEKIARATGINLPKPKRQAKRKSEDKKQSGGDDGEK